MTKSLLFFNRCFNKQRLKNFILWFFSKYGAQETIQLIENLKKIGFQYATEAGISIGIDDLKIPRLKTKVIEIVEKKNQIIEINYLKGNLTELEKQQQFVEEWNLVSNKLKNNVIQFFKTTDIFNPIYMMAFSGARGNISQVRQLVAMRGLMVDPQGQVLDFPIRSNFREGLNLTEYIISCYGARKGVVDTALRTATSGYLTRRLVDVAQQVIIGQRDCQTSRGITITNLLDGSKMLLPIQDRLIGRILLKDVFMFNPDKKNRYKIGFKNQEISSRLSLKLSKLEKPIFLRSPLTCHSKNAVCQMCYGWSLASSNIVSIGEAVGVLAAQSIGEPGTQLTMRTFHTGGVFTGGFIDQLFAPFDGVVEYLDPFQGLLVRTLNGQIGFLTKTEGRLQVKRHISINSDKKQFHPLSLISQYKSNLINYKNVDNFLLRIKQLDSQFKNKKKFANYFLIFNIPIFTILLIRHSSFVFEKDLIAELSSPSFLENQLQETEQDIFSPSSGQIFFEDLVLIEKITRDGNLQRMTYGLGSIWIITGFVWNKIFDKQSILEHGDLIEFSVPVQKLKILMENSYSFDLNLSYSIQKLKCFKANSFSIKNQCKISKFESLKNFLIKRSFFDFDFQKIQYRNFQYFILFNLKNKLLNKKRFSFIHFLTYRNEYRQKKHFSWNLNTQNIGLNFHFNQKLFPFYWSSKKQKPNFYLFSIYSLSKNLSRRFFFYPDSIYKIQSKLQQALFSRKKTILEPSKLFWIDFIEPIPLNKKTTFFKFYNWFFYTKIQKDQKEYFELPSKNKISFGLKSSIFKSRALKLLFISKVREKKILKNFFHKNKIFNSIYFIYLDQLKLKDINNKIDWVSTFQSFLILLNRQGSFNFQLFTSWSIDKYFIKENKSINHPFNLKTNPNDLYYLEQKLNWKVELGNVYKLKTIKNFTKPLLLNKTLTVYLSTRSSLLAFYIMQGFYISFYKTNQSSLETKNIKIGFKSKFKINLIPNLNLINYRKKIKHPIISKDLFFQKLISYLHKKHFLKYNFKKSQKFLHWPYMPKTLNWLSSFGFILQKGSIGLDGVRFDNHEIMVDFIQFHSSKNLKKNFNNDSFYNHIINRNKRFLISSKSVSNLILFQKIYNNIDQKHIFLSKNLLKQISFSHDERISLILNSIHHYYHYFKRSVINPKMASNQYVIFNSITPKKNSLFQKTNFFYNYPLKILIKWDSYLFLNSYSPFYKPIQKSFVFKNSQRNGERLNKKFNLKDFSILFHNSPKRLHFSRIKKLDLQTFDFKIRKKSNIFTKFYSIFRPNGFKNMIIITTFINTKNGEVISVKDKKKITFIILNQSILKSLSFEQSSPLINQNNLKIGKLIRFGDKFGKDQIITRSGQIIYIDKYKFIIRKAIPFLITSRSLLNVYQNEIIEKNTHLFTFFYHKIKTGDIIQGIPKIEEFFEARSTRDGMPLLKNLHSQIKHLFNSYSTTFSLFEATQKSFETIQYIIIDEIQKIYCSQGVYIADKHLEIIVRQMTSKVQILEGGQTGLLAGELIEFSWIRLIHEKFRNREILYEPIILGITKSSLETESFISAASFQETTRILSRAAIQNKIDFVRGLKQNVILGNLIPSGTGFLPFN